MPGITILCFAASYSVALAMEVAGLWVRYGWHRVAMVVMAVAGVFAHSLYLVAKATGDVALLGSPASWCLVVAWVLAAFYLGALFRSPKSAIGLFLLPVILGLIALTQWASFQPFSEERAFHFWGLLHGGLLTMATVAVCIGFLAGLMYLIQSWRLKSKIPPSSQFRLPSLEVLERTNGRSLSYSAVLVAGGFFSGVVLSRLQHGGETNYRLLADPVVLSLLLMLVWLVAAELFRLVYPAARQGRKVAYLTLAAFGFLVMTLVTFANNGSHGQPPVSDHAATTPTSLVPLPSRQGQR